MNWTSDEMAVFVTASGLLEGFPPRMRDAVKEGLSRGREVYGGLDLGAEKRDMRREAGQELRDALVYVCCLIVQRDDNGELFDVAGAIANAWRDLGGET